MDTSNSTASHRAATNARFLVCWHMQADDGEILGYQRCAFATKKAATANRDRIAKYHPTWNVFMGAL